MSENLICKDFNFDNEFQITRWFQNNNATIYVNIFSVQQVSKSLLSSCHPNRKLIDFSSKCDKIEAGTPIQKQCTLIT